MLSCIMIFILQKINLNIEFIVSFKHQSSHCSCRASLTPSFRQAHIYFSSKKRTSACAAPLCWQFNSSSPPPGFFQYHLLPLSSKGFSQLIRRRTEGCLTAPVTPGSFFSCFFIPALVASWAWLPEMENHCSAESLMEHRELFPLSLQHWSRSPGVHTAHVIARAKAAGATLWLINTIPKHTQWRTQVHSCVHRNTRQHPETWNHMFTFWLLSLLTRLDLTRVSQLKRTWCLLPAVFVSACVWLAWKGVVVQSQPVGSDSDLIEGEAGG